MFFRSLFNTCKVNQISTDELGIDQHLSTLEEIHWESNRCRSSVRRRRCRAGRENGVTRKCFVFGQIEFDGRERFLLGKVIEPVIAFLRVRALIVTLIDQILNLACLTAASSFQSLARVSDWSTRSSDCSSSDSSSRSIQDLHGSLTTHTTCHSSCRCSSDRQFRRSSSREQKIRREVWTDTRNTSTYHRRAECRCCSSHGSINVSYPFEGMTKIGQVSTLFSPWIESNVQSRTLPVGRMKKEIDSDIEDLNLISGEQHELRLMSWGEVLRRGWSNWTIDRRFFQSSVTVDVPHLTIFQSCQRERRTVHSIDLQRKNVEWNIQCVQFIPSELLLRWIAVGDIRVHHAVTWRREENWKERCWSSPVCLFLRTDLTHQPSLSVSQCSIVVRRLSLRTRRRTSRTWQKEISWSLWQTLPKIWEMPTGSIILPEWQRDELIFVAERCFNATRRSTLPSRIFDWNTSSSFSSRTFSQKGNQRVVQLIDVRVRWATTEWSEGNPSRVSSVIERNEAEWTASLPCRQIPQSKRMQSTRTARLRWCLTERLDRRRKIVRRFRCSSAEIQLFDEVRGERRITWSLIKCLQSESFQLSGAAGLDEDLCEWTAVNGWFDELGGNCKRNERSSSRATLSGVVSTSIDGTTSRRSGDVLEWTRPNFDWGFARNVSRERENQFVILSFENDFQEKNECVQRNLHWPRLFGGQSEFGEERILRGFTEDVMLKKIVNQWGHHRSMFNQIGDVLELFFDVQRRFEILDGRGLIVSSAASVSTGAKSFERGGASGIDVVFFGEDETIQRFDINRKTLSVPHSRRDSTRSEA